MSISSIANKALEQGKGVIRLAPNWVPRSFCVPGRRIKLHPDDYYAMGGERGGIDERWFASTTPADNGPLTSRDEGLSFIVFEDGGKIEKVRLLDAVTTFKGEIIGDRLWKEHKRWPMYSKFFDNKGALPHYIHHWDNHASLTSQLGKPEAYYYPPQENNYGGVSPYMFFDLQPGVTKEHVRKALADFEKGDNKNKNLSAAYRPEVGAHWDAPPVVLHVPGSLCTYEPQKTSDIFAVHELISHHQGVPKELLTDGIERMNDEIFSERLSNECERQQIYKEFFEEIGVCPDRWFRKLKHPRLEIQLTKPVSYDSRAQLNGYISDSWIPSYFRTYEKSLSCEQTDGICKLSDDPLVGKTRRPQKVRGIDQCDLRRHSPGTRHKVTSVPVAKPKDNDREGDLVRSKKIVIRIKKERTITIQIGQSLANRLGKLHWPFNLLFNRFLHKVTIDQKG